MLLCRWVRELIRMTLMGKDIHRSEALEELEELGRMRR
jgi:hypothetical protein